MELETEMEVGKRDSDACKAEVNIKMEFETEMEVGKRDSDARNAEGKIKMESETEMEVGKRDSFAEIAGRQKTTKEIVYGPDGWLELEMERDSVVSQMIDLFDDWNRLSIMAEQAASVETRPVLLSEANRWWLEFEKLKRRMKNEKKKNKEEKKNKEKRSVRNSEGGAAQELLKRLREVSVEIKQFVKSTIKVDLPMGNSKEGHATDVDLAMGNSKEGHVTEVDLPMGSSKEGHATEVDLVMGNSKEGHATEVDLAMGNSKEGHATEVDLAMGSSKEGHATEVDLAMENSKERLEGDRSQKRKEARKARQILKLLAKYEEWRRKQDEEERHRDPEELTDRYAYEARLFEKTWNMIYRTGYGRFEDNTSIPCKRYTFNPAPHGGHKRDTLQVFSVKVTKLTGGLQWPLNVFGMVALRDSLDHNRNVIFKRERDNCQTLTDENPYLVRTGPVRGVVFNDPVVFEVLLYVRGTTESDDKELSLLASSLIKINTRPLNSLLLKSSYTSRLSTLDFELGHIVFSVEATISVRVISSPPDGFYGEFVAFTDVLKREILLHNSGVEELHLAGDEINLSRSVVSVESSGKLLVSVRASDGSVTLTGTKEFTPLEKGTTTRVLCIPELCQLDITVAWSLFSYSKT